MVHCARTALQVTPEIRNSQVTRVLYQLKIHWGGRSCGVPVARARGEEAVLTWGPPVKVNVAWQHSLPPPPSFSKLYWQCRVAKPRHFHFHHLSNTRPDPHSTRPRELATDSRGAGPEGPFDQYVTRQTSKPVHCARTVRTVHRLCAPVLFVHRTVHEQCK